MKFGAKFTPIKTLLAKRRLLFKKNWGLLGLVSPLLFLGGIFYALFSKTLLEYPSAKVSEVGSIFKTTDFQVAFASNFAKNPTISMKVFENTGAFHDQENLNLFNFTNYENNPDELNSTLKSFSKNLLVDSEKVGDSRNGAVFIS